MPRFTLRLVRSVAVAALVAAPLTLAHAQSPTAPGAMPAHPATAAPSAANSASAKNAGVEQRITQLHSELKITADEESKWNDVAQAMRDNSANMEKLVAEKRQQAPQSMTAVDDLKTYQEFAQAHVDGLKNLISAFSTLYDSMSDQQKKNADQVFAKFNRAEPHGGAASHG